MKILYVAAEAVPFAKTGGLADVAGSLPKALKADGVDVRVIMPKFGKIPEAYRNAMEHVYDGELPVAWRKKYVGLDKYELDGVTYYFVDNEEYFNREGFYGYDDDAERFSFFSRTVANFLSCVVSSTSCTAMFSESFFRKGKGREESSAIGVSTG